MTNRILIKYIAVALALFSIGSCKLFKEPIRVENRKVPAGYNNATDTTNTANVQWRNYFTDKNLVGLIDTALKNNQELNITMQEINIARNEVKARKGEYLPFGGITAGAAVNKAARYTWDGQSEEEWKANANTPKYYGDFTIRASVSWELDIWKKLRNAKKAAMARYLGSVEGQELYAN